MQVERATIVGKHRGSARFGRAGPDFRSRFVAFKKERWYSFSFFFFLWKKICKSRSRKCNSRGTAIAAVGNVDWQI